VIAELSESLLAHYAGKPLIDPYDVYQHLMDYWAETMQDDVYLIAADGWVEAAKPRGIIEDKDKKIKETPDLTIGRKKYKMDLAPPALIVARYFAKEQAAIEALQAEQETAARELEEFVEEHTGEEGLLEDASNDKGKVTKGGVKDRLKAIDGEPESGDERDTLKRCLELIEAEAEAGKAVKDAQAALDLKVLARYAKLTETEIKTLVVEDKWFASIRAAIDGEVQRLTQQLAGRVKELDQRYDLPLPVMVRDVKVLDAKVEGHLKKMGLAAAGGLSG
jgi:type I restriction enzyme M protein